MMMMEISAGIHLKNWIRIFGHGSIRIFEYLVLLCTVFYKTSPCLHCHSNYVLWSWTSILVSCLLTSCSMRQPAVALSIDIN